MSFRDCLNEAREAGEISGEDAERLAAQFERRRAMHMKNGGPGMADAQAKKDLAEMLAAENAHTRRKAKRAMQTLLRLEADTKSYRTPSGKKDLGRAMIYKIENFNEAPFKSVTQQAKTIIGQAQAMMATNMHHFRRGMLLGDRGRWNKADFRNVAREAHGEDTGDVVAKQLVAEWKKVHEWLRQRFNAAGGAIGKLENWGFPHRHDARALMAVGRDRWKEAIRGRLDLDKMRNPLTGQALSDRELEDMLDATFDSITTGGWNDRDPVRQPFGKGALANQRAEHRVLIFRDAESWLEYDRDFGNGGDLFRTMMDHINFMARDIAAMEELGPNPNGTIEWMKQAIQKDAAGKGGAAEKKAQRQIGQLDTLWKAVRGELGRPVNEMMANGFGTARSLVTASSLGSAVITAITDVGTAMITRKLAGMPATGQFKGALQAFKDMERNEAIAAGLILDEAMNTFHAEARFAGMVGGSEIANWVTDRVLTWSMLSPWTQAQKHAFGLSFMAHTAKESGKAWDALHPGFRATFERAGFRQADWDKIRAAWKHQTYDGRQLIRPADIAERIDQGLADRYLQLVLNETEYAVPSGGNRSRTILTGNSRPGTFTGELLRNFAQFKMFGVHFLLLHAQRTAHLMAGDAAEGGLQKALTGRGAKYAASIVLSTTMFGAAAMQLKQLASGRDPRDMNDKAFWSAALLQGGALGIYGDFMFSNINRFGSGIGTTIAGPLADRANSFWNLTGGNLIQLAVGEDTKFGRETVTFLKMNTPGSSLWYGRLAFERVLWDNLQYLADPEAHKAFRNRQRFWQREYGQEYFWAPGTPQPQRNPDLGAAFGR